jgi:uncharacterized protein Smg (DUF494 family)
MEPNQELLTYITARKEQGITFAEIEKELQTAGWEQVDIDVAIKTLEVSAAAAQEAEPAKPELKLEEVEELNKRVRTHEDALIFMLFVVIAIITGFGLWWYVTQYAMAK